MGFMIYHGINYYNLLSEHKAEQKIVNVCNYKIKNYNEPQRDGIKEFGFLGFFNLVSSLNTASGLFSLAGHYRKRLHKKRPS